MAPREDPLIGQQVAGYTLEHRIGEGSIGIVYQGRKDDGHTAAIKVVRPELAHDSRYALTVIAEARAVSTIGHPSIVTIFDLGLLSDGRPFLVMELVDGSSLEDLLSYGPMDPDDALAVLEDLFAALDAAHRKNVLHRDIKPANIYLAGDASGRRVVKLLDFGLARLNFAPGAQASMVVGTPDYMAPEQASSKLTFASDLYAVGVVAFRMFTGQLPFIGQSTMEVIMAHVKHTPQKPSFLRPGLSPKIDTLVLSLLEKSPSQRPSSADVARMQIAGLRKAGSLSELAKDTTVVGDETFRPFVPAKPFVIPSLMDEDEGPAGRTEPFRQLSDSQPIPPDVTERQQPSPFGGKPAPSPRPPPEKAGNETLRDHRPEPFAPETPMPKPLPVQPQADDDEPTVSAVGKAAKRPDDETDLEQPAQRGAAPASSSKAWVLVLLGAVIVVGGAAYYWLNFVR